MYLQPFQPLWPLLLFLAVLDSVLEFSIHPHFLSVYLEAEEHKHIAIYIFFRSVNKYFFRHK